MRAFKELQSVIAHYQTAQGVKSQIKRTVTIALLDQTTVSHGELELSKGRVRINLNPPNATTIIFDKALVWVITPTPKNLGGRPQVLEIKSSAIDRQKEAPLALLLGDQKAWDLFRVSSEKLKKNMLSINLRKKKKSARGIQTIQICVDLKNRKIADLSYTDDLSSRTKFAFAETHFSAHLPESTFKFSPPKNAQITVLN